jgi:putative phosphoribosyl transferase
MTNSGFFTNRTEAGQSLAAELMKRRFADPVILALPRGGLPVALEVARALNAPLDAVLVRKIGVPWQPELAAAAVVDGAHPQVVRNEEVIDAAGVGEAYLMKEITNKLKEIERRRELYLKGRAQPLVEGRTAIVVDDGVATGATIRAALKAVRLRRPARLVVAIPVAPVEAVAELSEEADEVICLLTPRLFRAIGEHYSDFTQVTDEEAIAALDAASGFGDVPASNGGGR